MTAAYQFLETQSDLLVYTALFILIFLENTLPLAPGDGVLIITAFLTGRGTLPFIDSFLITVSGAVIGYGFLYYLGRFHGRDITERKFTHLVSVKKINKIDAYFHRYGYKALAIGRFIPGTRFIIGVMAGFTRMHFIKAASYTSISIILWNLMIFALGNYFTDNWVQIKQAVKQYNTVMLVVIGAAVVTLLILRRRIFKKKNPDFAQ
jgi:membrane protein DedA with SNARE-associated domain